MALEMNPRRYRKPPPKYESKEARQARMEKEKYEWEKYVQWRKDKLLHDASMKKIRAKTQAEQTSKQKARRRLNTLVREDMKKSKRLFKRKQQ